MSEEAGDPGRGSREVHTAFAQWHMMLAQVEGMAEDNWSALVEGRASDVPEWEEGAKLLRQSAEGFRAGADSCAFVLRSARGELERGYLEADVKALTSIADSVEEMAAMMEKREVPSLEYVHRIEDMMREQHMAMDRKTTARAALARMRGEA
jgi:hypothetical protein